MIWATKHGAQRMEREDADVGMRTLTDGRGPAARPGRAALAPDATGAEQVGKPADDRTSAFHPLCLKHTAARIDQTTTAR